MEHASRQRSDPSGTLLLRLGGVACTPPQERNQVFRAPRQSLGIAPGIRVRASQNPFVTVADFRDRKILPSPSIIRMLMNWKEVMIAPKEKNPVRRILMQIFNQSPDIRLISTNPECL